MAALMGILFGLYLLISLCVEAPLGMALSAGGIALSVYLFRSSK
jgi:hypothetical protein